jgi:hypothetical protein
VIAKGKATFHITKDKEDPKTEDLITRYLTEIADAPAKTIKKIIESNTKHKKEQFKRRFKYLNEKVSVARYPRDNNQGNLYFS